MIYRVILKVGYYESWFDFATINDAGTFAKLALSHNVPNEDRKSELLYVTIKVIDAKRMKSEKEDE